MKSKSEKVIFKGGVYIQVESGNNGVCGKESRWKNLLPSVRRAGGGLQGCLIYSLMEWRTQMSLLLPDRI